MVRWADTILPLPKRHRGPFSCCAGLVTGVPSKHIQTHEQTVCSNRPHQCIRGTSHGPVSVRVRLSVTSRSSTKTVERIGLFFGM